MTTAASLIMQASRYARCKIGGGLNFLLLRHQLEGARNNETYISIFFRSDVQALSVCTHVQNLFKKP